MKKTLFSAALAVAFGLVATQACAVDGKITFNGQIIDTNCTVTGGGNASGNGDIIVTLPPVSVSALSTAGDIAGQVPFSLILGGGANCTNGKTAALWVEIPSTPNLDVATGALKNTGSATNVEVQMLNGNTQNQINLGINTVVTNGATILANSNQPAATVTGNTATLNYVGQYLATGAATAGTVTSYLTYSMQYN
jgi:major type 1 subunit fimbrin (pilin)